MARGAFSRLRRPGWLLGALLAAGALGVLTGAVLPAEHAAPARPAGTRPGAPPFVTVFMVDGLSHAAFRQGLAAGDLPHIARCMERGVGVTSGIGAFPSMTGYAFYPFLTGESAARSGILGLRWFDRTRSRGPFRNYVGRTNVEMDADLHDSPPLLFEELRPAYSSAFNSYLTRGSPRIWKDGYANAVAKFGPGSFLRGPLAFLRGISASLVPDWAVVEDGMVEEAIGDLVLRPRLQWLTLTSPDGYHHVLGDSAGYAARLRHVDGVIGRYVAATRRTGSFDDRIFLILSDHGMVPVTQHVDPRALLGAHGLRIFRGDAVALWTARMSRPLAEFEAFHGVLAINGNTMAHLYVRRPGRGWPARPGYGHLSAWVADPGSAPVNLVTVLAAHPGVELVVARDGDRVRVADRAGAAVIGRSHAGYSYRVLDGDPLGYEADSTAAALLDGRPHPRDAWLARTAHMRFPFAVVRLYDLATAEGAGDLILTARPGYDFAPDYELVVGEYRGGHGGLRADQLRVPWVLCGPGIQAGVRVPAATAEDVGATLRHLLGLPADTARAGRVITAAVEDPPPAAYRVPGR